MQNFQEKLVKPAKCRICKATVQRRNGIAVSKYCPVHRKEKLEEKKLKHRQTKTFQEGLKKRLHKKAWKLMSEWTRRKNANLDGYVECFTCPAVKHWKQMDAGHYRHRKLDFDARNVHPQCSQCNNKQHGGGMLDVQTINLAEELGGIEAVKDLRVEAENKTYSILELDAIILDLEEKLRILNEKDAST